MRRYWYWPGWKGGNTRSRVGEGDKVLILGDYLGPQEVGEGENCVHFTDDEERGEMGVTSHLSSWLESRMPTFS